MLAVIFALYLIFGSFVISLYEPEMNFFTSFYFNFISLTTIGLGDVVPKNDRYLVITFAYLTVGLALTTMAIEIAADFLKKVHYYGRKIDATSAEIWFGGRKLVKSIFHKQLITCLQDETEEPNQESRRSAEYTG
jgi:hypothetical protein